MCPKSVVIVMTPDGLIDDGFIDDGRIDDGFIDYGLIDNSGGELGRMTVSVHVPCPVDENRIDHSNDNLE